MTEAESAFTTKKASEMMQTVETPCAVDGFKDSIKYRNEKVLRRRMTTVV